MDVEIVGVGWRGGVCGGGAHLDQPGAVRPMHLTVGRSLHAHLVRVRVRVKVRVRVRVGVRVRVRARIRVRVRVRARVRSSCWPCRRRSPPWPRSTTRGSGEGVGLREAAPTFASSSLEGMCSRAIECSGADWWLMALQPQL